MVTFEELRNKLLENLRARVRNGEVTERRLARLTGISQPHVHNLLKGVRTLTPQLGDQILKNLKMSLTDFVDTPVNPIRETTPHVAETRRFINMLDGLIGPSHPWPTKVSPAERYLLNDPSTVNLVNPVAVRTAEDVRMGSLFSSNDVAVLDQSLQARCEIDPNGLYLVKEGSSGVIRRARMSATGLYLFAEDCRSRPSAWQRIPLSSIPVQQTIRARVLFPADEHQWDARVAS